MKNTTIRQIKRVQTPYGIGDIDGIDPDTGEYCVKISKADATVPVQSMCIFKMVRMEDIIELPTA